MPRSKKSAPKGVKNPGRDDHRVAVLGVELQSAIKTALDRFADESGRTKRHIVEKALMAYMRDAGFWPWPPESSTS